MDLTKTHGIEMNSWYRIRLMVPTWNYGIDMDSWFRHGLMVSPKHLLLGVVETFGQRAYS